MPRKTRPGPRAARCSRLECAVTGAIRVPGIATPGADPDALGIDRRERQAWRSNSDQIICESGDPAAVVAKLFRVNGSVSHLSMWVSNMIPNFIDAPLFLLWRLAPRGPNRTKLYLRSFMYNVCAAQRKPRSTSVD